MAVVRVRPWYFLAPAVALLTLGVAAGACGGGGGGEDDLGQQISDPARVATATPLGEAPLYQIRGDNVTGPGNSTAGPLGTPTPSIARHTIQSGDTCGAIANRYGITVGELRAENPLINDGCTNLVPGEDLVIPGGTGSGDGTPAAATATPGASGQTYTVGAGDTCSDIAASYNVSVEALRSLNGLDADCSLNIGDILQIP
ncbi:MAG: LysM domain-containing protein [Dehalococcoidia bacterium]